eukprot:gene3207-4018_t
MFNESILQLLDMLYESCKSMSLSIQFLKMFDFNQQEEKEENGKGEGEKSSLLFRTAMKYNSDFDILKNRYFNIK